MLNDTNLDSPVTNSSASTDTKPNSPSAEPGTRCEFRAYHHKIDKGQPQITPIDKPFGPSNITDQDSAYALIIRRTAPSDLHKKEQLSLQINSPYILQAFREAIGSYVHVPSDFTSPCRLEGPFNMLVHHWDDLVRYREAVVVKNDSASSPPEMKEHLDLLFEFMHHEVEPLRNEALAMIRKGQITYDLAWVLYKPGDVMYTEARGHPWLTVCTKAAYEEDRQTGKYIEVKCTYTDRHGKEDVGEAAKQVSLQQQAVFAGDRPVSITELAIFPWSMHPMAATSEGKQALEARLRVRGDRFKALKDGEVNAYHGAADFLKEPPWTFYDTSSCKFRGVWLPYTEAGRVILDRNTFAEEQPLGVSKVQKVERHCRHCQAHSESTGEDGQCVPGIDSLYCPPYTMGFSLARKEWCRFYIDTISECEWKDEDFCWDALVLGDKEKLVLRSLVQNHEFGSNTARDQVAQKGKGLVVLLHGAPGSGKTLTAETAAEGSKKALLSTSFGDLNKQGYNAAFEQELKKTLRLATIWGAVVLLDEADVFLEAREAKMAHNTERNALVAIFLKELEYFSGIVFLTTNRVASFDPAMKSRVHFALTYSAPDAGLRAQIWRRYLEFVHREGHADIALGEEGVLGELTKDEINGREISNTINTARTIARAQGRKLTLEHIHTVLDARRSFGLAMGM